MFSKEQMWSSVDIFFIMYSDFVFLKRWEKNNLNNI